MSTNKLDPPSSTAPPAAPPPEQGSARLMILLVLLGVALGALAYDFLRAAPGCEAADKKIQAFVDSQNKKVANARFVKVVLNGQVVHENVEVRTPTGSAWRLKKEMPDGPLLLQGTHGPVAFRKVRIRPYSEEKPRKQVE